MEVRLADLQMVQGLVMLLLLGCHLVFKGLPCLLKGCFMPAHQTCDNQVLVALLTDQGTFHLVSLAAASSLSTVS